MGFRWGRPEHAFTLRGTRGKRKRGWSRAKSLKMRLTVRFRLRREPENRGTKTTWRDESSPQATSCRRSQALSLSLGIDPSRSPHLLFVLLELIKDRREAWGHNCLWICLRKAGREVKWVCYVHPFYLFLYSINNDSLLNHSNGGFFLRCIGQWEGGHSFWHSAGPWASCPTETSIERLIKNDSILARKPTPGLALALANFKFGCRSRVRSNGEMGFLASECLVTEEWETAFCLHMS